MADYVQNLDARSLVSVEAVLSFVISPFTAPPYNLPVFLFGVYAQESVESNQSLKLFTGLVGGSIVFDIIWFAKNSQNWFLRLISVLIFLLKLPTTLSSLAALRQRGEQFSGLGVRGGDLTGPTVWSMPGGFSSFGGGRNGYETVDDEAESRPRPPPPAPAVHVNAPAPPPAAAPASAPGVTTAPQGQGGYQAV